MTISMSPISQRNRGTEILLHRRDTHLDSMYERLKEERVRRVVEPVFLGKEFTEAGMMNDVTQYALDLGVPAADKGRGRRWRG